MLPRDRGWAASSNTGRFWNWELLPRQLGCITCKRWKPTEQNPSGLSFLGKKISGSSKWPRAEIWRQVCNVRKARPPPLPAGRLKFIPLCNTNGKIPFFYPAVLWDAPVAQYTEDTGSAKRQLPLDSGTRLFTYQKISLFFKNDLKNQPESGNHLIM